LDQKSFKKRNVRTEDISSGELKARDHLNRGEFKQGTARKGSLFRGILARDGSNWGLFKQVVL
jgi:hypothetical protein